MKNNALFWVLMSSLTSLTFLTGGRIVTVFQVPALSALLNSMSCDFICLGEDDSFLKNNLISLFI